MNVPGTSKQMVLVRIRVDCALFLRPGSEDTDVTMSCGFNRNASACCGLHLHTDTDTKELSSVVLKQIERRKIARRRYFASRLDLGHFWTIFSRPMGPMAEVFGGIILCILQLIPLFIVFVPCPGVVMSC